MNTLTPQTEDEIYKQKILELEEMIAINDKERKKLTKQIHDKNSGSPGQRRAWYILRRKRKKEREKLVIKLDLLRK